jgi:hypothetical protein
MKQYWPAFQQRVSGAPRLRAELPLSAPGAGAPHSLRHPITARAPGARRRVGGHQHHLRPRRRAGAAARALRAAGLPRLGGGAVRLEHAVQQPGHRRVLPGHVPQPHAHRGLRGRRDRVHRGRRQALGRGPDARAARAALGQLQPRCGPAPVPPGATARADRPRGGCGSRRRRSSSTNRPPPPPAARAGPQALPAGPAKLKVESCLQQGGGDSSSGRVRVVHNIGRHWQTKQWRVTGVDVYNDKCVAAAAWWRG